MQRTENSSVLFEEAEQYSREIELPKPFLKFLYSKTRSGLDWDAWQTEVKKACALDHLLRRRYKPKKLEMVDGLIVGIDKLTSSPPGTLFLTFHGGFVVLARPLFATVLPRALQLTRDGGVPLTAREDSAKTDHRAGLFNALRAIEAGASLMLAPDGPNGNTSSVLKVLDCTLQIANGAAFLAHISGCNVVWFTVLRRGERFFVDIEDAPRAERHERFEAYKERLHDFYGKKIEGVLTGEPDSLYLGPKWVRLLTKRI